MLKIIYTFFLGLLLAFFIGFGINTFYASPVAPPAPDFGYVGKEGLSQEQQAQQTAFDKTRESFDKNHLNPYNRNVSIAALAAAVILVAVGLLLERRIDVMADGALLGGVFTLIYSLGRAMASQDSGYAFVTVAVGLIIVLGLGYLRFVRPSGRIAKPLEPNHS